MSVFNTIAVIGLGYIGLPTSIAFTQSGKRVIGIDVNQHIVDELNQGRVHIEEPNLLEMVQQAVRSQSFFATTDYQEADAFIIAVPTPFDSQHQPDLSYIQSVIQSIAPFLKKGNLVVLESTSPVGTTEKMAHWLQALRPDLVFPTSAKKTEQTVDIHIAHCPERVLPGKIMTELFENDRIIGGLTSECTQQAVSLYQLFVKGECITTDARTAEMCKLTENSFRDVNIAFANELSLICDRLEINVWELIRLANRHPRVNILQPGAGVGGHCIAVDPWFIVAQAPEQAQLIKMARAVNDGKPQWVIEKVKTALADCVVSRNAKPSEIKIACLGLAFKADVDDLRESPALAITEQLAEWHTGTILAVEPHIKHLPVNLEHKAQLVAFEQALSDADILVLLVDHSEFKSVTREQLTQQWIVDTRGVWSNK
ncbi:UDP-N-acetyl-D-mannosamine dehydrogenase [Otariodibacter sp.]|uniref:UDP-N-acetyl-D-mannosamine dehydrogenase n=1 Tax=Otariodibacter sp. TaxID=3030919 RepID=UPI002607A299|nr:UDP-N-acetyl-D-mannosamine dehydrogenase [Otariodibacter sp.]